MPLSLRLAFAIGVSGSRDVVALQYFVDVVIAISSSHVTSSFVAADARADTSSRRKHIIAKEIDMAEMNVNPSAATGEKPLVVKA